MSNLTFAVLVDGENAQHSQYVSVLQEVEKYGSIAIKWVYADWSEPRLANWKDITYKTASRCQHQFNYGKDAADHALVMDAIELISHNARINAVCIVSSDGGFYSLAQRIREKGIHVMAVGNDKTPERFIKACHNFVFVKNLSIQEQPKIHQDLDGLLVESYKRCAETSEPVYLGDFGKMIKTIDSAFDPRSYGSTLTTLKKLIREKQQLFDIVGEQVDRCFVQLKAKPDKLHTLNGKVRKLDKDRGFGFITSNSGDFYFNKSVCDVFHDMKQGEVVKFEITELPAEINYASGSCPSAVKVIPINRLV